MSNPKPRTASSSSSGATRVRGAAAMWENKLATNTDSSKPGTSPTSPKHNIPGGAVRGKRKPVDTSNPNGSPRTPMTSKSTIDKVNSFAPRTLTPPTAFKASNSLAKPASRARSGSVSARSASPPATRSTSPPPVPPVPTAADAVLVELDLKREAAEEDSVHSEDDKSDIDELKPAVTMSPTEPIESVPVINYGERHESVADLQRDDVASKDDQDNTKMEDVTLDGLLDDMLDEQLDTVQLDDDEEHSFASLDDESDFPKLDTEPDFSRRTPSPAPLDFSARTPSPAPLDFSAPASKERYSTTPSLPDPEPVITPAETSPHSSRSYSRPEEYTVSPTQPGPALVIESAKAELDVTDLPRRSTSRPRTPPSGSLAPGALADASRSPGSTHVTPAKTGFQSIFGRMMPATTPVKDTDTSDAKSADEATTPVSAAKDRSVNSAASGKSFFSSATSAFNSIQLPSVSLSSVSSLPATASSRSNSQLTPPADSPATLQTVTSPPQSASSPGASWRTTMSSFLQRGTSPQPSAPPPVPLPVRNASSSGAALLLKRFDSATASRDRRISREAGDCHQLREGFERVRNEMEGAARDIRRERAGRGESIEGDVDWTFWGAVVQDYEEVARTRPKDLSRAIQQGIPAVIRGPIWQLMSSSKSTELEETYKTLLKLPSPHEKAIQKDITRTFPSHKFFQGVGAGQDGLFMVVKAYSLYDQEVGYTQGLAFVVASLLLNMPDEEAFCVLVRLMDSYNLRSHYLADMPGLQLRLYQFDRLVEDILPLLHNHLVRKGIKSSMYASQWFMTLFSYRFPLSLVYRVLDIVLAEGIEATFRFALALLQHSEDELLNLEFEEILAHLTGDLYEGYRQHPDHVDDDDEADDWRANDFVRDAYQIRITPLMLDQYESEWAEKCRAQNAHSRELDQLRNANRHLSQQVKSLESSLATMNTEHVELVRQLVMAKIAKEDMETELVRYKSMCAQLAQGREEDVDSLGRSGSAVSLNAFKRVASRDSVGSGSVGAERWSPSREHV